MRCLTVRSARAGGPCEHVLAIRFTRDEFAHDAAARHDEHAVGDAEQFDQVAGEQQNAGAIAGEPVE